MEGWDRDKLARSRWYIDIAQWYLDQLSTGNGETNQPAWDKARQAYESARECLTHSTAVDMKVRDELTLLEERLRATRLLSS